MKALIALILLGISGFASAEVCTAVIKDRNGYEYQSFTRSSYSKDLACNDAVYDCNNVLFSSNYNDATCVIKNDNQYPAPNPYPYPNPNPYPYPNPNPYPTPNPYPNPSGPIICQSDLIDNYSRTIRTFTAPGANEYDACRTADNFCKAELSRRDSYGSRCVNRGLIGNRNNPRPRPPQQRTKTEQCTANRYDPSGMFIQSYHGQATGPIDSDVKRQACNEAYNFCSRDLRGRQTCNLDGNFSQIRR